MRQLIKFIYLSLAYFSFIGTAIAQDQNAENKYRDVHWGLDEGLSQSIVTSMLEDVNGFLWVQTEYGLDRFDGKTFKTYLHDSKKSGTIAGNNVHSLIEDSLHNLWIGTDKGLSRYDIKADTFSNFSSVCTPFWATTGEVYCIEGNSVVTYNILSFTKKIKAKLDSNDLVGWGIGYLYTIYNSGTNSVWFLKAMSQSMGIGLLQLSLSDGKENVYNWPDVKNKPALNNTSEGMKYDKKRNCIWINAAFGLLEFSLSDKKFHHIDAMDKYVNIKDYHRFVGIDIDRQGRIWFATTPKGILIYNPADNSVTLPFAKDSVLQHDISDANACIYCDRNDITWSGFWLKKGIDEILPFKPAVKHYIPSPKKDSLNDAFVMTTMDAGNGKLWIGTGGGINILDTKTDKFRALQQKDLPGIQIEHGVTDVITIDTIAQKAWLLTFKGIFKMDMLTKKCTPIVFKNLNNQIVPSDGIPEFDGKKIFITTPDDKNQGVFALNMGSDTAYQILSFPAKLFDFYVTISVEDKFLFLKGDKDKKDNQTYLNNNGKWLRIHTPIDSISRTDIAYNKKDNTYWVAGENQLFHYNKDFRIIKVYTPDNGLPELQVVGIIPDNNGNIWFHTDRSIQELNVTTGQITTMSEQDGFDKQEFGLYSCIGKDKSGNIYFGGATLGIGLTKIDPNNLTSPVSSIYLKSLTINQKPYFLKESINYTDTLSLKYNQTKITLDAGIIDFYSKGRSRLRYKLERKNSDEAWQYASYYYTIRYEGLQPGDYWLIMQASNASNEFNGPEKKLFIHISPPFWDTWWFRVIAFLCILALVFSFIQYRSRNLRKKNILLEEKVMHRTKELKHSLEDLRATQAQLIQSEKMASLGELTAGIAHEIQNPLNFVNNFSEVNKELLDELKEEADKGNIDEVKAIANDVIDNSKKISHHGQRADAIVKGMLQHSRQTQGAKEPTDINALCDEYLRLSYHGLRAKDKNFNADFTSDFDETIGKITIVPQDIGRVLLNLFNNAFYAVSEKKKLSANNYQPTASVATKKLDGKIEIRVSDNGNGIPQHIIDKIFQPFFTTKPTGEGTGLGLSLAYDIITKEHSGTINVQSKEDEGSTFIIRLPVV